MTLFKYWVCDIALAKDMDQNNTQKQTIILKYLLSIF